jgi:hypothetical protein
VCYGMLRAAACVDESDHHALMYVPTVREEGVGEGSAAKTVTGEPGELRCCRLMLRLTRNAAAFAAATDQLSTLKLLSLRRAAGLSLSLSLSLPGGLPCQSLPGLRSSVQLESSLRLQVSP